MSHLKEVNEVELLKDVYGYIWNNLSINNCNSYIIGRENPILIDSGLDFCLKGVVKDISSDGIEPDKIGLVLSTHSHPDHFEGIKYFTTKGVKMALHPDEDRFMKEHGRGFYDMFGLSFPEYQVDFFLKEGKFKFKDTELEIYHTPGHSPGSVSVYLPEKKVLIPGDVLFHTGVGRTDFPGGKGSLLRDSIERLSKLDVEYLLPGHGEIVKGSDRV